MSIELIYKTEAFEIIGKCMEVHNALGHGFSEIVYKDALEIPFNQDEMFCEREVKYDIYFRGIQLKHKFYADFVVMDKIVLEIKSCNSIINEHISQTINYLKASGHQLVLLINFGKDRLEYKRIVY
ncbi:NADH:ubiquinone oxidoreductase [Pedobacter psychrophilus]|uniref:NADH:ubiquinone oxidoreductase n=1 Tax=Pedobacter psychrophilus TaxID=1826909 RepID=A0A179DMY4_9SPHI|nr:GxxExxY protein [Pedobacter psychrophilus]OAQ42100.1 NADH:ubiquinone oxidoreductase [Pedobacter psychrophilus]